MLGMRERAAFVQLSAQAPRQTAQVGSRARFAVQPVLCTARLPPTQDTTIPALSRTEAVSGCNNHPDLNPARGRDRIAYAAPHRADPRRPQNRRSVASLVARCLHGNAILANRARQLYAPRR